MMQSPGSALAAADGTLVEPADVDAMVGMFQSLLPTLDAGEAQRRLAEHGWDLQAAIKWAAREDAALAPVTGRGSGAKRHRGQQSRSARDSPRVRKGASRQ